MRGRHGTAQDETTGGRERLIPGFSQSELVQRVTALEAANASARDARRAALNLMEDAVHARRVAETISASLQLLAEGAVLDDVLAFLIDVAEQRSTRKLSAGITTLNGARTHFQRSIGKGIPADFHAGVEGAAIDSSPRLCARALRAGTAVVEDCGQDPGSQAGGDSVVPAGFASGWSVPIISWGGQELGTFDNYYRDTGDPTPLDRKLVDMIVRTAAIAIERKRIDEELARRNAELLDADRGKNNFLAILSHELRSPLNAIRGWVDVIRRPGTSLERINQGLEIIDRQSRAQADLISDLMDVQRLSSGKIRLETAEIDLVALVGSAVQAVLPSAKAKQLRIKQGSDYGPALVLADGNRLQQVFWNLLSNAIKFTPAGGELSIAVRPVGTHVEVTVSDTGNGIAAEALPHLFERFRQADPSTSRSHGGLGLGLAISKQLVELHGGIIRGESPGKGRGAVFTVTLPLLSKRRTAPVETQASQPVRRSLGGALVLVVDDEMDARELLRHAMESAGAEVIAVASADEATDIVKDQRPNVLVSDIGMPVRDGYDLIRTVRALPSKQGGRLPAIALTAYGSAEDRERALRAGFDKHLLKPVDCEELLEAVASLISRS